MRHNDRLDDLNIQDSANGQHIMNLLDELDVEELEDIACGQHTSAEQEERLERALGRFLETVNAIQTEQKEQAQRRLQRRQS
jgi:hypothetical protein